MSFRKFALASTFALTFFGIAGFAEAEQGFTVEVLVVNDSVEIHCQGGPCELACPGIVEVLPEAIFFNVQRGCVITVSDGVLLNEAMETTIAFLETFEPIPGEGDDDGDDGFIQLGDDDDPNNDDDDDEDDSPNEGD